MNIKAFEYYNDNYDLYFVYKNANSVDTDMLANHSHRTHEMYYLREGQRNFFINGELRYVTAPSLIIISPSVEHRTAGNYPTNYSCFIMNMNLNILPKHLLHDPSLKPFYEKKSYFFELDSEEAAFFDKLLSKCALEFYDKKSGFNIKMYEYSLSFLNKSIDLFDKGNSVSYSEKITHTQRAVVEIIKYIENHAADNLSLEFLSEKFFVSPCHLSRSFKMIAGMSLHDYISKVRLNKVKSLLDNHREKKLSEICKLCGFNNETHLIRSYKAYFGITPHQYKINKKHK